MGGSPSGSREAGTLIQRGLGTDVICTSRATSPKTTKDRATHFTRIRLPLPCTCRRREPARRLTNDPSLDSFHSHWGPAVSPDGGQIAFTDANQCSGGTTSVVLRETDV